MAQVSLAAEPAIAAPAERVYRSIAEDRDHHRFLPPTCSDVRGEEGAVGAGTVARFQLSVGGRARGSTRRVTEPKLGRMLTEPDPGTGSVTSFTFTPNGPGTRVRIETPWSGAGRRAGLVERFLAPRLLRRRDAEKLARLDHDARERAAD